MPRPKTFHVGAGVVTRYRNGTCTFTCRHGDCRAYSEPRGWRAGLRQARQHAADHDATEARYVGTPWGVPAHELPRPTRHRRLVRRLAVAVVVLALTALAFTLTVANVTGHAAPQPAPAAPSIAILPTTTKPAPKPVPEGYDPIPAGPPATDANGQWTGEADPPATWPDSCTKVTCPEKFKPGGDR
jgi:hypothetical protein